MERPSAIDPFQMDEDPTKHVADKESFVGSIEFKNVWFRYPTRKETWVLRGLNLKINPKESIALVGESGCGKSTFVNLLLRFYDVDEGEILIDGRNIKEYNIHSLRKLMGYVMQEPTLFHYSILENILYGKRDALNSEIQGAAKVANALDFIENKEVGGQTMSILAHSGDADAVAKFPASDLITQLHINETAVKDSIGDKKYNQLIKDLKKLQKKELDNPEGQFQAVEGDIDNRDNSKRDIELSEGFLTQCGLKGTKLSGGQKQRVAIARSIIREPKLLVLDEATSALDEDSQKKVQDALEKIMKERTSIVIAHRLSTIQNCDKIFVLEQGKLIQEGGFHELK